MTHLLDATAVIDLVSETPGAERLSALLGDALVLSVHWLEVQRWSLAGDRDPGDWTPALLAAGLRVVPFDAQHAAHGPVVRQAEARIRAGAPARGWRGMSTADVACLATAAVDGLVVVTSDVLMSEVAADLRVDLLDHRAG